jgi:hypothetical protein
MRSVLLAVSVMLCPAAVLAHGGGLNAEGCHNDRKNGGYHCHRAAAAPARSSDRPQANALAGSAARPARSVYYANCAAARTAGAAPVRRGDPGYGQHLDRDNDGVGCE